MGFPTIMYLSRSKVNMLEKAKKHSIQDINFKATISSSPSVSIEAGIKNGGKTNDPRGHATDNWPPSPSKSMDIALRIEKQLKKSNQIGTMADFLNKNQQFACYKLKGKLRIDGEKEKLLRGVIKCHVTKGRLVLDGTDKEVLVDITCNNIAGMLFENEKWRSDASGANHFLYDACTDGYDLIGLFTYEGESTEYFAECGILYFANLHGRSSSDKIQNTIYNEYV